MFIIVKSSFEEFQEYSKENHYFNSLLKLQLDVKYEFIPK